VTSLVERIPRKFGEQSLTGTGFFDMAKPFDTVWIDGLLFKLTILNLPSYLVHTISSYHRGRPFEAYWLTATTSRHVMRAEVAQGGLISSVLFSLYVNDMQTPSHHVQLALYADHLEPYLSDFQRWLSEWRIAINVSNSSAMNFKRARRRFN
jgi:hypothetical protein